MTYDFCPECAKDTERKRVADLDKALAEPSTLRILASHHADCNCELHARLKARR